MQALAYHHMHGPDNAGFKGTVEEGSVYAIEPFNTTGQSGHDQKCRCNETSSNIIESLAKSVGERPWPENNSSSLGAQLARNLEERYSMPFAERWAFPMLEKPF